MKNTKVVKFEDLINILHMGEADIDLKRNVIETPELHAKYQEYYDTFIEPIYQERGYDVGFEADTELGGLVFAYEE